MAYTAATVPLAWPDTAQYTATGDEDLMIPCPAGREMFWAVNDTKPTESPSQFATVPQGRGLAMTMLDGESLWLVAPSSGSFTIQIQHA